MANDFRGPNRGMFGYEGEGFMRDGEDYDGGYSGEPRHPEPYRGQRWGPQDRDYFPHGYSDLESGPSDRGWNIGRGSDTGAARPSYRGRGPKNYQRSDERIHEEVCERLAMDHDVDASEIEVAVQGGVVTLSGSVHERRAKRLAEDIADSVTGVNDVQNNLRVTR